MDGRYRVIIAGGCGCENARSRNAQAGWTVGLATFCSVVESRSVVIGRQRPRWSADVVHRMQCHENN